MNTKNNENGKNLKPRLNSWDVGVAMRDLYDTLERAMLPGILLGDTAYQIKIEGKRGLSDALSLTEIEWGFPKKHLTSEIKSLFKTWQFRETPQGFEYEVSGVPVKIRVYGGNYDFLRNPDQVFYGVDEFRIPNPFDKYWKIRNLIK